MGVISGPGMGVAVPCGVDVGWEALAVCADRFPGIDVEISAQSHLQRFYGALGFAVISEEYVEDGIPHVDMVRSSS